MNMIKTLQVALAVSLLGGTVAAHAASYDVNGTLTGFSSTPGTITASFTPTNPTFTGSWNVDTSSLIGDTSFAPYTIQWSVVGHPGGSVQFFADDYHLDSTGGTVAYNAATRQLSITSGLLTSTNSVYECSAAALICGAVSPTFQLNMLLTFTDASLSAFNGTATATDNDGQGSSYSYNWSFNGQTPAVPVPAAIWLFGSSLVGLAGVARSRKNS